MQDFSHRTVITSKARYDVKTGVLELTVHEMLTGSTTVGSQEVEGHSGQSCWRLRTRGVGILFPIYAWFVQSYRGPDRGSIWDSEFEHPETSRPCQQLDDNSG